MDEHTAEQAQHLIDSGEIDDILDEMGQRIINGSITRLDEASDHLAEQLLNSRLDCRDARGSVENVSEALARRVWGTCQRTARRWADEETDVDRLLAAFAELHESGIVSALFSDWKSMAITSDHRGAVLVRRDDWQDLSFLHRRRLTLSYVGAADDEAEIGRELTAALRGAGLPASAPHHGRVTVRVLWKWHVPDLVTV
ncbi:hypothetical protein [Corynebacterium sp. CCM 9204]|uniref:DUF6891 domain-containing protein n=1 Tax=Corynebacterium sp. CCM 9204 TaxID=3057616 RepID=UPI0035251BEC